MRSTLAYSSSRILLFVVSVIVLHLIGIGGLLLWALAFVISMLVSYVLLSKQRDAMSVALAGRLANRRKRGPGLRARLEEGARVEDGDNGQADEGLQAAERGSGSARRG
ncbi:MAG: DUF4229 domain-containing protein [Streptosporangiaceae bacterium]|nr:DUF4229 domain-containing protein [Streptosporangiaceae bacterium]